VPYVTTPEQVRALELPEGWEWHAVPAADRYAAGYLTRGIINMTPIVRRSRAKLEERLIALFAWAKENNAALRVASYQAEIQGAKPPGSFQLWFATNERQMAEYEFLDGPIDSRQPWRINGRVVPAGTIIDATNNNTLSCSHCRVTGVGLAQDGDTFTCTIHTRRCTEAQCTTLINASFRRCSEHGERISCANCTTMVQLGGGARDYHSVDGPICARCANNLCRECSRVAQRLVEYEIDGHMWYTCEPCRQEIRSNPTARQEKFDKAATLGAAQLLIENHRLRPVRLCSIEMETADGGINLAPLYRAAGLSNYNRRVEYHQGGGGAFCYVERNASLGETGGEVIFDRLRLDKLDEAQRLEKALNITRKEIEEGRVTMDMRCGLHIHVDAHGLGVGHVRNLALVFNYLEDVLYRLSAAHYRKHRGLNYAAKIAKGSFADRSEFGLRFLPANGHTHALNIGGYWAAVRNNCQCGASVVGEFEKCKCNLGKNTIEFRVFNGTANPRKLHAYIALAQSMIAFSAGMPDLDAEDFPVQEYVHNAPATAQVKAGWPDRLRWILTNLYFSRTERDSLEYVVRNCQLAELGSAVVDELFRTTVYAPPKELVARKVEHKNSRDAQPDVPRTARNPFDGIRFEAVDAAPQRDFIEYNNEV